MSQSEADDTGWRGADEGGKLKESGAAHWNNPNTGAINESGFSALAGGSRSSNGNYYNMGITAYFWSSSESHSGTAWHRALYFKHSVVTRDSNNEQDGFSVRCVRD